MQETKLADADAPVEVFRQAGYELAHEADTTYGYTASINATTARPEGRALHLL